MAQLDRRRPEAPVVESVRDDTHRLGVETEQIDEPARDEVARADDTRGGARRAVVGERAEGTLAAREERRQVEVLKVVHGDDGRRRGRRQTNRQRVVHDVGACERTPKWTRTRRGEGSSPPAVAAACARVGRRSRPRSGGPRRRRARPAAGTRGTRACPRRRELAGADGSRPRCRRAPPGPASAARSRSRSDATRSSPLHLQHGDPRGSAVVRVCPARRERARRTEGHAWQHRNHAGSLYGARGHPFMSIVGATGLDYPCRVDRLSEEGELMALVVINAVTVPDHERAEFEARFAARAGNVSGAPGFEAFELMRPLEGGRYLVYTRWASREAFEAWMRSGPILGCAPPTRRP